MNDELPTDERVRRIERGVARRIGARRVVAQRIAVAAVAVVVVGGGFALIRPMSSGGSATSAAGSAASAAPSTALAVECHGDRTVTARVDPTGLPASALVACARAEHGSAPAEQHAAGGTGASATPAPSTLCETVHGALHVYPGPPSMCATHGMHPYAG
jgi:hypothetical protein